MKVELLIIGNEILIGKIQDTNSNWLAKKITKYGHQVKRISTVGDDLKEISSALKEILTREPDIIISSGGLGPTYDDMTLQGIALGLNRELELDKNAYATIKKAYENAYKVGILKDPEMTKEKEKMARLPKGSIPLPNTRGTAPGVKTKEKNTIIYCLPGIPFEMQAMFTNVIIPVLKDSKGQFIEKGFIFDGIGESEIAPYISEIKDRYPKIWIKTHPRISSTFEIELSITCFNVEDGESMVDKILEEIRVIIQKLKGKIKN